MPDNRLQKAPEGLLGAFNLKTLGDNPDVFAGTVVPGVEIIDFYLANELQVVQSANATVVTPAVGNSAVLTVPVGQAYRVIAYGLSMTVNVADIALTSTWIASVYRAPSASPAAILQQSLALSGVGLGALTRSGALYPPNPLYLTAGWSIAIAVGFSAAPSLTATFNVRALVQVITT